MNLFLEVWIQYYIVFYTNLQKWSRNPLFPSTWLEAFQSLVNSAYHSVFTFLVRVERIYSDSWLSSSLAAKLLRGVTRPSADVYSRTSLARLSNNMPLIRLY